MKKHIYVVGILATAIALIGSAGALAAGGLQYANVRVANHEAVEGPEHRNHEPIRIYRRKIVPSTARIQEGDALIWTNDTEHLAQVIFPLDAARKLLCKEPSNFVIEDDLLRSIPMRGNEFASVCVFTKGTYDYEVVMLDIGPSGSERRRLKGTLVIE